MLSIPPKQVKNANISCKSHSSVVLLIMKKMSFWLNAGGPVLAIVPPGPIEEDSISCSLPDIEIELHPAIQARAPAEIIITKEPEKPHVPVVSIEIKRIEAHAKPITIQSGKTSKFRVWSVARPHMRAFHFGRNHYIPQKNTKCEWKL
jgi:hypothetical protein